MNKNILRVAKTFPFAAGAFVSGHTCYTVYKQVFFVENECIKSSYYGNLTTPFDPHTEKAIDAVFDKLVFVASGKQCALTQFYWSNKATVQHRGSTLSRFGTYVGVPIHFKYQDPSEVDLSDLESSFECSEKSSELLQRLKESLVLSENAKKFALASEFLNAHSFELPVRCNGIVFFILAYAILQNPLAGAVTYGTPQQVLAIFVALASSLFIVHYITSRTYFKYVRVSSDRKVAKFGDDFLKGGIEYFEKLAEKNKVLRELDPKTSGYLFEPNGDEVKSIINFGNVAISDRLTCLQKIDKEIQETKDLTPENSEDTTS